VAIYLADEGRSQGRRSDKRPLRCRRVDRVAPGGAASHSLEWPT
jgi:hypothetical protein